jgi:ABC-type sugar transport system ATPase subunit
MIQVSARNIKKSYGDKAPVLHNISFDIEKGKYVVIVGPSGCGKSTLLRIIAGLEQMTSGDLYIADRKVNSVLPSERDIGMVFQEYALYPHMTVLDNIQFGLKMKKVPPQERQERVKTAAVLLGLEELLSRKPAQLSGGQRQRVAIGRAIVKKPQVFLFDEPLSNLDTQLRSQMRVELASLHKRLGSTTIHVTHDQIEAMTLADQVFLLKDGTIQQKGPPLDLFHRPASLFVASFIGSPQMNLIKGKLEHLNGKKFFRFGENVLQFSIESAPEVQGDVILGVRAENLKRIPLEKSEIQGDLVFLERHGSESHLICRVGPVQLNMKVPHLQTVEDSRIGIQLERSSLHWFDSGPGGKRLPTVKESQKKLRDLAG